MSFRQRGQSLLPEGLTVDWIERAGDTLVAVARSPSPSSICPVCGRASARVHGRYERCLGDLPAHGRQVRIRLQVRCFRCGEDRCPRHIFAERLGDGIAQPWSRRSARLQEIVHHVALMLGGRPGQSLARRLLLPVSNDTLLRAVRRRGTPRIVPPTVIGIDDWAWRRNQRYETIVCDLERRRTIALLPDRDPATAEAWLHWQRQIEVVARDRGGGYGLAIAGALPQATRVADRWHLMENASRAFLDAVRKSMRQTRGAIGAALWRQLRTEGFRDSLPVVTEWATRRRRAEKADRGLTRAPSSRTIARLMTIARDWLSRAETVTVTTIGTGVPQLVEAHEIIAAFQGMIRRKSLADLVPWLERARMSLVASFANGVMKDEAAVAAAITSGWSNGQAEGQLTELKLVKRQMYGRGKIDLLQARVIGPA